MMLLALCLLVSRREERAKECECISKNIYADKQPSGSNGTRTCFFWLHICYSLFLLVCLFLRNALNGILTNCGSNHCSSLAAFVFGVICENRAVLGKTWGAEAGSFHRRQSKKQWHPLWQSALDDQRGFGWDPCLPRDVLVSTVISEQTTITEVK